MYSLPFELTHQICQYLDVSDIVHLEAVGTKYRQIVRTAPIWSDHLALNFPLGLPIADTSSAYLDYRTKWETTYYLYQVKRVIVTEDLGENPSSEEWQMQRGQRKKALAKQRAKGPEYRKISVTRAVDADGNLCPRFMPSYATSHELSVFGTVYSFSYSIQSSYTISKCKLWEQDENPNARWFRNIKRQVTPLQEELVKLPVRCIVDHGSSIFGLTLDGQHILSSSGFGTGSSWNPLSTFSHPNIIGFQRCVQTHSSHCIVVFVKEGEIITAFYLDRLMWASQQYNETALIQKPVLCLPQHTAPYYFFMNTLQLDPEFEINNGNIKIVYYYNRDEMELIELERRGKRRRNTHVNLSFPADVPVSLNLESGFRRTIQLNSINN